MRIVHVADFVTTKLGYQELLLAKWNARHGHDVTIVTSNLNPPAPDYDATFAPLLGPRKMSPGVSSHEGVQIHRLKAFGEFRTRILIRGLEQRIRELRPEAILCHGTMSPTSLQVARIGSQLKVPVFMDNHMVFSMQDTSFVGRSTYAASKLLMRSYLAPRVERFYGVASECSDFLINAQGAPPEKVGLLPLGVDTELFSEYPAAIEARRNAWGIPEDALVVTQTGKMEPGKDPLTLAIATSVLMDERPDLFTVFLGSGPADYLVKVRGRFAPAVLDRVRFLPAVPVTELAEVYAASDVIVFPGGTSLSALEAAACGRCVVMTDQPASLWRAELGVGVTFPEGDATALGQLLRSLVASQSTRGRIASRAQRVVAEQFSYDRIAAELESAMLLASGSVA